MEESSKRKFDGSSSYEQQQPPVFKGPRQEGEHANVFDHHGHGSPYHAAGSPQTQQHLQIDYLARESPTNLQLLDPSADTLQQCATIINQYSLVLDRSESLANNLGAKSLSSILLARFERMFDGPPQIVGYQSSSHSSGPTQISWLDIAHASVAPEGFAELEHAGKQVVELNMKSRRVRVSWEEWQMVRSGMLQNMLPAQPVAEDEEKELGTLDILEDNVSRVVTLADQVAARGRQLNHRLQARRTAIAQRREASTNTSPQVRDELRRTFGGGRPAQPNTPFQSTTSKRPPPKSPPKVCTTDNTPPPPSLKRRAPPNPQLPDGPFKSFMTSHMEILPKGARVYPPCDRCRRLRMDCLKHLTACVGCTKKHCKCAWREVSEEECARGGLISQSNGVLTGLGAMGEAVSFGGLEGVTLPPEVHGGAQSATGAQAREHTDETKLELPERSPSPRLELLAAVEAQRQGRSLMTSAPPPASPGGRTAARFPGGRVPPGLGFDAVPRTSAEETQTNTEMKVGS